MNAPEADDHDVALDAEPCNTLADCTTVMDAVALRTATDDRRTTDDHREPWMCTAHLRDGSGELCKKPRMRGQSTCASHGGSSPQAKAAAKQRLLESIDPIMGQLIAIAQQPNGFCPTCRRMADAIKLRAILACVERAFDVPADAAIDAPPADDSYLRWLSDAEFDTFLSLHATACERKRRGDPPLGDYVRLTISEPRVEDRVHRIHRVIVDPPSERDGVCP